MQSLKTGIFYVSLCLFMSLGVSYVPAADAKTCTMYCAPGKSYACGNACIPNWKTCSKNWTSACNEEKPKVNKKGFKKDQIKHVDVSTEKGE